MRARWLKSRLSQADGMMTNAHARYAPTTDRLVARRPSALLPFAVIPLTVKVWAAGAMAALSLVTMIPGA